MNDLLIKRLNAALEQGGCTVLIGYATVEEAATEIERLRRELERVMKLWGQLHRGRRESGREGVRNDDHLPRM
jgi:hypothetical protein